MITGDRVDIYISDDAHIKTFLDVNTAIKQLTTSKEIRFVGQGYALNYTNLFGFASEAAIAKLKEIKGIYVNQDPPEISNDRD